MRRVYHFSPLCKLPRQRNKGIADTDAKKGPPPGWMVVLF
jgi:hypothetical protein